MIFLIDTTTNPNCIGIWNGKKLKTKIIESTPEKNREIVSIIQKFIKSNIYNLPTGKAGSKFINHDSITAVAVICGPGAFTGVRTGVVIANTISYSLKVPIYALDTLTAQIEPLNSAISLLSASNNEVYFARFEKGKMKGKIELIDVANNFTNRLQKSDVIFGDLKVEHASNLAIYQFNNTNAKNRITNLLSLILGKKIEPIKKALPLYIKKPNITQKKK